MHGRLKVKTTEEQQEAKRKERQQKLKLYNAGLAAAFAKREHAVYDKEGLTVTGELLLANPDFYTLWNIRREILSHLKETWSDDEVVKTINDELYFLEQCLRVNPKSYGSWHHRCWVLDNSAKPDWKRELQLCNRFLEYDERNFHCWDYRRFVVKRSQLSPADELAYTTNKISTNFSNFSSWHYRSKLLPLIHRDPSHPVGVKEGILLEEFELAQNAFFTDPSDQSAWFYHRWLLGRGEESLSFHCVHVSRAYSRAVVLLSKPVHLDRGTSIHLFVNDIKLSQSDFQSPDGTSYCKLWICQFKNGELGTEMDINVKVSLVKGDDHEISDCIVTLKSNETDNHWAVKHQAGTRFSIDGIEWHLEIVCLCEHRNEMSAIATSSLTQELEACQQLHDMEPDNKWVLLTVVELMRAIDYMKYQADIMAYLDKLIAVDPTRTYYYKDLRSKCKMEFVLESQSISSNKIILSHQDLTCLPHLNHLITMTAIDLSHNLLEREGDWSMLQCVKKLDLSGNKLESCNGMHAMTVLEDLNLENNNIEKIEQIQTLGGSKALKVLRLSGNPICQLPGSREQIQTYIPSLTNLIM